MSSTGFGHLVFWKIKPMSIHNYRNLAVLLVAGWSSYFAVARPATAGGQIVPILDPVCDDCHASVGQSFCRKVRLHCIYARRACSQKYVLLPTSPSIAPYLCPPNGAGRPEFGSPSGQPTIGGYSNPPRINAPAGVYIR